jgi:hypothetical protein
MRWRIEEQGSMEVRLNQLERLRRRGEKAMVKRARIGSIEKPNKRNGERWVVQRIGRIGRRSAVDR